MSYAPQNEITNVIGSFVEKTYEKVFEYKFGVDDSWAARQGATHSIFVKDGIRPAKIKKTVAYIMIDEDENGAVWEKWEIKNHKKYNVIKK